MSALALLLPTASAWDERGPEGAPTGRTVEAGAIFVPDEPDWSRAFAVTPSSELGYVARGTARELREQRDAGTLLATSGLFAELGVDLDRVLATLDRVATTADEDRGAAHKRLEDPAWLARTFDVLAWRSDGEAARRRGQTLAPEEIRLTKYVVWQVDGSPVRTEVFDTALYAPPDDALRAKYARPEVYAGVYEPGGEAAGQARPLVWLTREGVNEALLQGTVEVRLQDGSRMFNVLLNNGIPYDPKQKDPNAQRRYWYFHEVEGVLGVEQIPLRPRAAVAGDVYNVGLGKIVALEWQGATGPELHLAVLADTGGAFQPNLFQLDWLAGTFPTREAFEAFDRTVPPRVRASVLVEKSGAE